MDGATSPDLFERCPVLHRAGSVCDLSSVRRDHALRAVHAWGLLAAFLDVCGRRRRNGCSSASARFRGGCGCRHSGSAVHRHACGAALRIVRHHHLRRLCLGALAELSDGEGSALVAASVDGDLGQRALQLFLWIRPIGCLWRDGVVGAAFRRRAASSSTATPEEKFRGSRSPLRPPW